MTHTSSDREWLDIVNENDEVIGRCTRAESRLHNYRVRLAHIFIVDPDTGRIAVCQRSASVRFCPLHYGHSASGYVTSGETADIAAAREMQEEIGLTVPLTRTETVASSDPGNGQHFMESTCVGIATPDMLHPNPEDVASVVWMTAAEIQTLLTDGSPCHPLLTRSFDAYLTYFMEKVQDLQLRQHNFLIA